MVISGLMTSRWSLRGSRLAKNVRSLADFALSAGKAGLPYPELIERIVPVGDKDGSRLKKETPLPLNI
jgi:hypothetical protein